MARLQQITIIGVGLIGGSFARALKKAQAVETIVGAGRDAEHLQQARDLGVIDHYETDLGKAVTGSQVVVLATPLGAMQQVLTVIKPHINADTILTDVGSAKTSTVAAAQQVFGQIPKNFVPGHPIAGNEKSGVQASFAELYQGRRVILTPAAETSASAVDCIRTLWQQCGAQVIEMQVQHHDEVLAATSHLPHMLAYALVDTLARMDDKQEIFAYAAGGFRDFTRIASSDPQMWHDICLANRDALVAMLQRFKQDLDTLTTAVARGDGTFLKQMFTQAKQARDQFCDKQ